jgi:asparaginyl-tRNA synthetase
MASTVAFSVEKRKAILKIRAEILKALRLWFASEDFTEVQGPIIIPKLEEQPNQFQVEYFSQKAYLGQGLQPYSDTFVGMFGKIYSVTPAFRAEKVDDKRHLSEFWRIEVASSNFNLNALLTAEEKMVRNICRSVSEMQAELAILGRTSDEIKQFDAPFPRITYDDAVESLQREDSAIVWGQNLDWGLEKALSSYFSTPFFVTDFPLSADTFLYESNPKKPELALTADLIAPEGYGELSSGGQLISKKKILLKRLMELELTSESRRWYLSFRQKDPIVQSCAAMGLERLTWWICHLQSISEASAFPRFGENIHA